MCKMRQNRANDPNEKWTSQKCCSERKTRLTFSRAIPAITAKTLANLLWCTADAEQRIKSRELRQFIAQ